MTRLLTLALLAALCGAPALSQTAAPVDPAPATADAVQPVPSDQDDDDDDDHDEADGDMDGEGTGAPPPPVTNVEHHDYGPSGIMTRSNREDLAPLTLASGKPVATEEYALQSGGYYRLRIVADGSAELALSGGDFFRAIWINEVVISDIEIRPMGVHSIEFDAAGEALISFIAIQPGRYTLSIPGSSGESQQAVFNIR